MTAKRVVPAKSKADVARAARLLVARGVEDIAREQADEPGSIHLLLKGDEAVGAIVHRREHWQIGRAKLKVARVWECSGESGEGSFARTGDRKPFDTLVGAWCEYLRTAGYHLAFAHGELALWPVHGFYPSFYHPRVYVPVKKALRLKKVYRVRSVKTSDAKPVLRLMGQNQDLRPRVYATGVPNFHHYAVEGPGRRVYGYFSMAVSDGNGQPPVFIPEVEVENRDAAETILAHAAPFAEEKGMRALHFPLAAEHPFSLVCLDLGGYHQMRGPTRDITLDEEMVRIVDVRSCLEALEPEFDERLRRSGLLSLSQDFVLDVEGEKVPLSLADGTLKPVARAGSSTKVRLPRWFVTQLVMGFRSPGETERPVIRPAGIANLFGILFPRTWPLSLCDHDLWNPSLRNAEKYCDEALAQIRKLRYPF